MPHRHSTAPSASRRPRPGVRRRQLMPMTPGEQLRAGRLGRRLPQLVVGLGLYGVSMAMMIRSELGLDPWDVLHVGLARHLPTSIGQMTIVVGVAVLALWIPLRQRPGLGTVANALLIGVFADLALAALTTPGQPIARAALLVGGVTLNGVATACYIGAQLGPGPRDGLMTGLTARTAAPIGAIRAAIEVTVVALGWVLGGTVGIGTILYALAIGPLVQLLLPLAIVDVSGSPEHRRSGRSVRASGP